MHTGRSHHPAKDVILSVVGGFAASFVTFTVATQKTTFRGQLIAGDPSGAKEFPTTLGSLQSVVDGSNPVIAHFSSWTWWTMVVVGGLVASFVILKMIRRYV